MAFPRACKMPSKYDECITGDEDINNICEASSEPIETLNFHNQVDGKTNNVSFKTLPSRIEAWQNSLKSLFGEEKTSTKNDTVIKITCDIEAEKNCSIKINFYSCNTRCKMHTVLQQFL